MSAVPRDNKEGTVYPDSLATDDTVNCPAWVLRTEHGCFVRAGHAITVELMFQPPLLTSSYVKL